MKVRVSVWRITWRYLIFAIIILAALYGATFNMFITNNPDNGELMAVTWGASQYLLVIFSSLVLITFYILSIFGYYYVIEDKYFVMYKYKKEYVFDYKSIEFIDIEESKRKKQVIFYSPRARTRYLLGDKNGKLLETLIKKCPNTLSVAQFRAKHPEEKY